MEWNRIESLSGMNKTQLVFLLMERDKKIKKLQEEVEGDLSEVKVDELKEMITAYERHTSIPMCDIIEEHQDDYCAELKADLAAHDADQEIINKQQQKISNYKTNEKLRELKIADMTVEVNQQKKEYDDLTEYVEELQHETEGRADEIKALKEDIAHMYTQQDMDERSCEIIKLEEMLSLTAAEYKLEKTKRMKSAVLNEKLAKCLEEYALVPSDDELDETTD
jgi:chromosome segregation ATPase